MPFTGGAIPTPIFMPALRQVTAITNAFPAAVTTSFAHGYLTGAIVKMRIPPSFGMEQMDGLQAPITVTSSTTFNIAIDSTNFDVFSVPAFNPLVTPTPAQSINIGEITSQLDSAFMNILMPLF